jgi:hypothetical protein
VLQVELLDEVDEEVAWTPLVLSLQAAMFDRLSGCCQVAATSRGVR